MRTNTKNISIWLLLYIRQLNLITFKHYWTKSPKSDATTKSDSVDKKQDRELLKFKDGRKTKNESQIQKLESKEDSFCPKDLLEWDNVSYFIS